MKLLYAEDELNIAGPVREILQMEGYEVLHAADGAIAWEALQKERFDAVILDIMMPNTDGLTVLSNMRSCGMETPVLLLTAKAELDDRVEGLSVGADDYLTKPFAVKELLARLNALLRRARKQGTALPLTCGNTTLLPDTNELKTDVGSLRLSNHETALLALLLRNPDTAFTHTQLALQIWQDPEKTDAALLYLSYLDTKLTQLRAGLDIVTESGSSMLKVR